MISILKQALAKHPFQPITVVLSNGMTLRIANAEFAYVLVRAGFLYVELPDETEPRFINLRQIAEVRVKDLAADLQEDTRSNPE